MKTLETPVTILVLDWAHTGADLPLEEQDAVTLEWRARLCALNQGVRIIEVDEHQPIHPLVQHSDRAAYIPTDIPTDIVDMGEAAKRAGLKDSSQISRAIRHEKLTEYRSPVTKRLGVSMSAVIAWRKQCRTHKEESQT